MSIVSNAFTATGNGTSVLVPNGRSIQYTVTGTFVGTYIIEKTTNNGASFTQIATGTVAVSTPVVVLIESVDQAPTTVRARCSAYTSGTMTVAIESMENTTSLTFPAAGNSKVGATAGWVVAAADNLALVTLPASQTNSTLVLIPSRFNTGMKIVAFYLVGQIESGGGTATITANLRKGNAAAADVVDSSIVSTTALSVTADTVMSAANTRAVLTTQEFVDVDENFYLLITATTAAATDFALQAVVFEVIA